MTAARYARRLDRVEAALAPPARPRGGRPSDRGPDGQSVGPAPVDK